MKRCTHCVLPETQETIHFDEVGRCSICKQHDYKHERIDWTVRKKELDEIVAIYQNKHLYDCIVPFSGGKDSTYTLYYLMKEYKLKPLVIQFDHGFLRPTLLENNKRTLRRLGADFLTYTPNWKVVQKLMLQSFIEKGDFCWHCHTGIFAFPMQVALRFQVPLVIWGEPSSEYTSYYSYEQKEEADEKRFNRFINLGITADDMFARLEGAVEKRDLHAFQYPQLKDLRRLNYRSICLGTYIPWDTKKQYAIIQKELGWKGEEVENVPPGYSYEKIECCLQGVRDYIKYIKRGFSRPTHLASLDIRNKRMTREQALELLTCYEGKRPPSLDLFLKFVGLSEEEFMEIAMKHAVSPYQHDPKKTSMGTKTHDFDQWCRDGKMPADQKEIQYRRWQKSLMAKASP